MGRRVAKSLAISSPSLAKIKEACEKLGFKTIIESEKAHPRLSNVKSGRLIVLCGDLKKRKLIQEISKMLRGVVG